MTVRLIVMKLGLNLSFATKRWLHPSGLARMCREDFNVDTVQFTLDLIDPWWPEEKRDEIAAQYKTAFDKYGVKIKSVFGGVAAYTYSQLLSPTKIQREISVEFFKRMIDLAVLLGADEIGSPIGGMSYEDAKNPITAAELYESAKRSLCEIAEYGHQKELRQILIEATPLVTEFLYTPQAAKALMTELDGKTKIPVRLLIDWGHALFNQIPGTMPDMAYWLKECAPYVGGIHLQQTDGLYDRHWDFTKKGLVNAELIKSVTKECGADDIIQYLEVVTIFEEFDDKVYDGMLKTMKYLHEIFDNN